MRAQFPLRARALSGVAECLFRVLEKLSTGYNIRYFKWDMNRVFTGSGWREATVAQQRELWLQYARNLYDIIGRLRSKHPKLEIEACSGGGRVYLGILQRLDEVWPSGNTDAFHRLRIQEGFTQAYAPKIMPARVTDVPNLNGRSTPLKFRVLHRDTGAR